MSDAGLEFQAAQGTPDQLPQGAATTLNEAMPPPSELAGPDLLEGPESEMPMPDEGGAAAFPDGTSTAGRPEFAPQGLDEEILFLDTDPTEPAAVQLPSGRLPDSVVRMLETMGAAAAEPTAPESLRAIYAATLNALDSSLR